MSRLCAPVLLPPGDSRTNVPPHTKPLNPRADTTVDNMGSYYAILESLLKFKDKDMKKFQEVVEGG